MEKGTVVTRISESFEENLGYNDLIFREPPKNLIH